MDYIYDIYDGIEIINTICMIWQYSILINLYDTDASNATLVTLT